MGTLGQKLDYLTNTKSILKQKINNLGGSLTDQSTFRSYGDYLDELYDEMPKVTGGGTEITLAPTRKGRMSIGLKGNTEQEQLSGKNLLPNNLESGTSDGITCTKNADGSISVNGTATARHVHAIFQGIFKAGTYTLSGVPSDNTIQKLLILYNTNTWAAITSLTNQSAAFTLASDTPVKLNITIPEGSTANNILIKPQLEQGLTATEYEQYCGGQPSPNPDYPQPIHVVTGNNTINIGNTNYPINLGSMELCKIRDYKDFFYKENGNWYESKRINKYKLSSGFIASGGIRNNIYRILTYQRSATIPPALDEKDTILTACTHFVSITRNQSDSGNITTINGIAMLNSSGFMISLPKDSDLSSVSAFKTFVDNNDIIIYYILATPIVTQITDETLISQLDAIENAMSTTDTTIITQTNNDLPFIISASALKTFTE